MTELEKQILKIAETLEGVIGIAIKHLQTGEQVLINGDMIFPTASVFKVPVLVELFNQVKLRKVRLDERIGVTHYSKVDGSGVLKELDPGFSLTVKDLATLMIIVSDNTATDLILDILGIENVNETMKGIGLKKTKVVMSTRDILFDLVGIRDIPPDKREIHLIREKLRRRKFDHKSKALMEENNDVSTPFETMLLLEKIARREIVDRESCEMMIDILKRCQHYEKIPLLLPLEKVEVAHKVGGLPGIRNDVGIIYDLEKQFSYILCAFTKKLKDELEGDKAIAHISKLTYDYFSKQRLPSQVLSQNGGGK